MNKTKIIQFVAVGSFISLIGSSTDKIADRPTGENPTKVRLAVAIAAVVLVNYGSAMIERAVARKFD